ncbi:hypothetical protein H0H81_005785, partial [Sphagnurus paluster]
MSESMPSWRYITSASSRISSFKDFLQTKNKTRGLQDAPQQSRSGLQSEIPSQDERTTWRSWAGQKIRSARGAGDVVGAESLDIFPGWAVRRYRHTGRPDVFEVEVFVSGYASSQRSVESRSQRAFIRLAKGFAALPKITADAIDSSLYRLTPSTEELLAQKKLPPRPTEITEDYEIDELERQFKQAQVRRSPASSRSSSLESRDFTPDHPIPLELGPKNPFASLSADALRKLHANLESRLLPFWSSALSSRTVRIHLFTSPSSQALGTNVDYGPVITQDVVTAADGSFQARLTVPWEQLCHHPNALHIAFDSLHKEHGLLVSAEILPSQMNSYQIPEKPIAPPKFVEITLTHSPIRVISDIDDTIKLSNILSGARVVFQNVFVKELHDNIIPGMGEWYSEMWRRGVRFHYV